MLKLPEGPIVGTVSWVVCLGLIGRIIWIFGYPKSTRPRFFVSCWIPIIAAIFLYPLVLRQLTVATISDPPRVIRNYPILSQDDQGLVAIQLLPPLYSSTKEEKWDKVFWTFYDIKPDMFGTDQGTDVKAINVEFSNGALKDRDVSVTISPPFDKYLVRSIDMSSDRIRVIGGGAGSSYVQLLAPELVALEHHACIIDLQDPVSYSNLESWEKQYGQYSYFSEKMVAKPASVYRVQIGPEEAMDIKKCPKKYRRKIVVKLLTKHSSQ